MHVSEMAPIAAARWPQTCSVQRKRQYQLCFHSAAKHSTLKTQRPGTFPDCWDQTTYELHIQGRPAKTAAAVSYLYSTHGPLQGSTRPDVQPTIKAARQLQNTHEPHSCVGCTTCKGHSHSQSPLKQLAPGLLSKKLPDLWGLRTAPVLIPRIQPSFFFAVIRQVKLAAPSLGLPAASPRAGTPPCAAPPARLAPCGAPATSGGCALGLTASRAACLDFHAVHHQARCSGRCLSRLPAASSWYVCLFLISIVCQGCQHSHLPAQAQAQPTGAQGSQTGMHVNCAAQTHDAISDAAIEARCCRTQTNS
jgi:hypothetical protein